MTIKVLCSLCQQIWKTQQWSQDCKRSIFTPLPKNVQTITQLCSFHILARICAKFFKLSFSCMWTENFQMHKLGFKEAEEQEIKLPTSLRSWRKQRSFRKTSTSALLTIPKPLTVWITTNWKILNEMGIPDHLICLQRNVYADQEATVRTGYGLVM